jgi:hypothetical protein
MRQVEQQVAVQDHDVPGQDRCREIEPPDAGSQVLKIAVRPAQVDGDEQASAPQDRGDGEALADQITTDRARSRLRLNT